MAETFGDYDPPALPKDIERIRQQRKSARITCAAQAIGRTRVRRREDLADLLSQLGLWPSDDPLMPVDAT
jgi:hypothetical protein